MDSKRTFAFIIGAGMLLMILALAGSAMLGDRASDSSAGALLGIGAVLFIGGVALWLIVEKPVTDPYKEPAPDYGHGESKH